MRDVLLLAVAGALGTVSRHAVNLAAGRFFGDNFPFGILLVNVAGTFLLAFITVAALSSDAIPNHVRIAVTVGFLGAFTTFSTFGVDTMRFLADGGYSAAGANIAANILFGLIAAWMGLFLGKMVVGSI